MTPPVLSCRPWEPGLRLPPLTPHGAPAWQGGWDPACFLPVSLLGWPPRDWGPSCVLVQGAKSETAGSGQQRRASGRAWQMGLMATRAGRWECGKEKFSIESLRG